MAHYLVDGINVPAVRKPNVGEIMYAETMAGKSINDMTSVEQVVMQFVVSIRRFPELREKYTWDHITDIDSGLEFDVISPTGDVDDEKAPEMVPDPTAHGAETERSGSSESTLNPAPSAGTGNTSSTSGITSGGHLESYGL